LCNTYGIQGLDGCDLHNLRPNACFLKLFSCLYNTVGHKPIAEKGNVRTIVPNHSDLAQGKGCPVRKYLVFPSASYPYIYWPINIYSDPEIAQIGQTETQLKQAGIEYKSAEYSLSANGKALAEGASEGFLRLLYEPKYSQVLGVQIVASNATDMIAEAAVLMELEGTVYDLAKAVHAHPTVAEVFMDAGSEAANQSAD